MSAVFCRALFYNVILLFGVSCLPNTPCSWTISLASFTRTLYFVLTYSSYVPLCKSAIKYALWIKCYSRIYELSTVCYLSLTNG